MIIEEWKPAVIDGISIDYYVSTKGRIKKLDGSLLKPHPNNRGYLLVTVKINGVNFLRLVHRIVACTFIPNPQNKRTVNHKDGDKSNNTVYNLEWMTYSENNKHAYDTKLHKSLSGVNSPFAKKDLGTVIRVCQMLEYEPSVEKICNKCDVDRNFVNSVRDGRAWQEISRHYKFLKPKHHTTKLERLIIMNLYAYGYTIEEISIKMGWSLKNKYLRRIKKALRLGPTTILKGSRTQASSKSKATHKKS